MQITVQEITTGQFMNALVTLKGILTKAKTWGEPKKIEMETLLQTRLAPDMFPLGRQIQIACDNAKGAAARLTGVTAPVFEDTEKNFDDYIARIHKTMAFLEGIKPEQFSGYETKMIEFPWYPGKYLTGKDYVAQYALPNFYFHMSAAYMILRANGVDLGKGDYLATLNWKTK